MLPESCSAGELRGGCLRPRGTPSTRSQPGRDALRGGPGRGQTSWWPAVPRSPAGDQNPFCRSRRLLGPSGATFISCPFSGALGKWEMGGIWMGCLMQGSTKPAALSGWPQSLPGIGASSVPWRWHLQGSRSLTIGSTPGWENSAARWGQPAPTRDPPPTEADRGLW